MKKKCTYCGKSFEGNQKWELLCHKCREALTSGEFSPSKESIPKPNIPEPIFPELNIPQPKNGIEVAPLLESIFPKTGTLLCAVCGKPGVKESLTRPSGISGRRKSTTGDGRNRVIDRIMDLLRFSGSFSVGGVEQFWDKFSDELCPPCQLKLNSASKMKQEARKLLEEAVELDPGNDTPRQNLRALKEMI
jgi:predicted amidophosphoribosyltransferase